MWKFGAGLPLCHLLFHSRAGLFSLLFVGGIFPTPFFLCSKINCPTIAGCKLSCKPFVSVFADFFLLVKCDWRYWRRPHCLLNANNCIRSVLMRSLKRSGMAQRWKEPAIAMSVMSRLSQLGSIDEPQISQHRSKFRNYAVYWTESHVTWIMS